MASANVHSEYSDSVVLLEIASLERRFREVYATMRAKARFCASLQVFGRCARSHAA